MSNGYINLPAEGGGGGVSSLNALLGDLDILAGSGISVTPSGTSITIANTATAVHSFTIMQPDHGTSPTASSSSDTLTYTSSDGTVTITGNSSTKTLNFQAASSGANTLLSNLGTTAINASLLPNTDNSISLGSTSKRYANIYSQNIYAGSGTLSSGTGVGSVWLLPGGAGAFTAAVELYAGGGPAISIVNNTAQLIILDSGGFDYAFFQKGAFGIYDNANNVKVGMDTNFNFYTGNAALATTATNGFTYIPTCAGAPTGIPTAKTGLSAMILDSTNGKFWMYYGGAWHFATMI